MSLCTISASFTYLFGYVEAVDGVDGLQIWEVVVNVLNKQAVTAKPTKASYQLGRWAWTDLRNLVSKLVSYVIFLAVQLTET